MKKDIPIRIPEENYKRLKSKSKQLNITQTEFMIIANSRGTGMSSLASNTSRTIELTKQIQHLAK